MADSTAWLFALMATGMAFMDIPRQYLAIPIGFFVLGVVSSDNRMLERHRTHTHAADGSVNGIRGW